MKFHLNHDPANKTLTIPRAALQLSGLAETSDLTIHTENGCVLLLPEKLSVAQTLKTFQLQRGAGDGKGLVRGVMVQMEFHLVCLLL